MTEERRLPLEGLRVLDFSQVQMGPMATQILADFGADVIKVERPRAGDISRSIDVKSDGIEDSASFLALNRNKRSIVIDMKSDGAMDLVHDLLAKTDVLVANFRAGVASRMGLDYDQLRARYPRLIYVSGTGFGEDGPWRDLGGQDMVLQSVGGATWHDRDDDGRPRIHPIPFVDFGTGMAMVQGILLAIIERGISGLGQRVDVSLLDTAMFEQLQELTAWTLRRFEIHWERDNLVGSFRTSDGWVAVVGLFRPDPLEAICRALEIDDLTERHKYADGAAQQQNRAALFAELDAAFGRHTTEDALARLAAQGVLSGPVLDYDGLLANPQVLHNDVMRTMRHPVAGEVQVVDNPIRMSAATSRRYEPAPLLGQHTREVLSQLGYDEARIEALSESGVVASS